MNIDIRGHIINNFKEDNKETLRQAIEESIENNDDITLPGMGVFLELIWKSSDDELKEKILDVLDSNIKNG